MSKYQGAHMAKKKISGKPWGIVAACVGVLLLAAGIALWLAFYHGSPPETVEIGSLPESSAVSEAPEPEMLPYMEKLYKKNPDLVGYIKIDGTRIDGPVLFTAGEDYYLYRGFDKKDNINGCFYVDKHNKVDPRDTNLLIHGHNMDDGTMFHDLLEYNSEEFYKTHKRIRFDSLYEAAEYEIVSVFISQVYNKTDDVFKYYKFYDAKNEKEFNEFVKNIKELALYDTGVTAQYGDELITLSTCEYTREDGRMVVVARKITGQETTAVESQPERR